MTNSYESPEFLIDGSVARTYDELSYHDKIKVKALQGLDQLAASLNSIANVKAIEFQINHLNTMTEGFTEQMSAKDAEISKDSKEVVYETADLWFHSMVMLSHLNIPVADILTELERRFGLSGLEEKANRTK